MIEVNLPKAVLGGNLPFYVSENQVILSPGTKEGGYVPPENFRTVLDIKKNEYIYMAPFDYIVVYDFECQCDEDRNNLNFNVSKLSPPIILLIGNNRIPDGNH